MAVYLIDSAVLEEIADNLIKEKYPNQPAGNYAAVKKEAMLALDHQILKDVLKSLTREQGQELNSLLEKDGDNPDAFEEFFKSRGIDLSKILEQTLVKFREDFLKGGGNA